MQDWGKYLAGATMAASTLLPQKVHCRTVSTEDARLAGVLRRVQRYAAPARVRLSGTVALLASRRSASQTLITDCLVTPSLLASRSNESIIHVSNS